MVCHTQKQSQFWFYTNKKLTTNKQNRIKTLSRIDNFVFKDKGIYLYTKVFLYN